MMVLGIHHCGLWIYSNSVFHQLDQELSAQYRLAPLHITLHQYTSFHFPFGRQLFSQIYAFVHILFQ